MNTVDFDKYFHILTKAKLPEDVFGDQATETTIHEQFTKIAFVVHPDKWSNVSSVALIQSTEIFKLLNEFRTLAKDRLAAGTYGQRNAFKEVVITTKKNTYTLTKLIAEGDLCSVYYATKKGGISVAVKIINNPRNNDLLDAEKETLSFLHDDAPTKDLAVMEHIGPKPIDDFEYLDGSVNKHALVFPYIEGLVTIEDVIKAYPKGIDIRDAAWMINRLLGALLVPQQANIVHGALVPNNFLLDLPTHNGLLIDWAFSVKAGTKLNAVSTRYRDFYPKEVFDKQPVNIGLDIYMAAKMFIQLIGGDVATNKFPTGTPKPIEGLFRACLLGPKHRTLDPYELHSDFSEELKKLYGPRKFRPFTLTQ